MPWQFWLDVGGTFTDCLARAPDGALLRRKVLSSSVTKGRAAAGSTQSSILDPARTELDNFWTGYQLRLLDEHGETLAQSTVARSSSIGRLEFEPPLTTHHSPPTTHACSYELLSLEEAPLLAIRLFLGLRLDQPIPPCTVRLGTTRGTNALLTHRGAKTAFVTTRGFADILKIGYQNRPKLFELAIKKPEPLFSEVAEIDERISSEGCVLTPPTDAQIQAELARLKARGIESLAICLLNSYANPLHEQQVEQIALELGFAEISVSSRVSPLMKIVPRGDTTVVDAYLNPVLRTYVERLSEALASGGREPPEAQRADARRSPDVRLMTSAGGLASTENFTGKDCILSGPAGGVVGFSRVAEAAGFQRAIGFDMGGTSTDVSRYDGRYEYEFETQKAGVRIVAPMLAIETVAAGGGSICKFDGVKLVVGPDSAGADPGPACYGRGGPLTITDCNLLVGRIAQGHFPFPLDLKAAEQRLAEVAKQLETADQHNPKSKIQNQKSSPTTPLPPSPPLPLAAGFLRIANANMAAAIRSISIAKGYDPREYILVAFGAAAPQHACAVASELGITKILIHPDAGVLSALGIGLADVVKHRAAPIYQPLAPRRVRETHHSDSPPPTSFNPEPKAKATDLTAIFADLENAARTDVASEGLSQGAITVHRSLDLRYQGADAPLSIAEPPDRDYAAAFATEHRRLYGYVHESRPLEIVAARVEAIGRSQTRLDSSHFVALASGGRQPAEQYSHAMHPMVIDDKVHSTPLYHRDQLLPGTQITGPAILVEPLTTTIIDPRWEATVLSGGELLVSVSAAETPRSELRTPHSAAPDPILLELFNNHFTALATQMGITLRNTSMSVNVKERLDFSCAIFTPDGDLVVNAPHIPVHLGAMGQTVKQIIADNPAIQPGDVFVTNDPYRGGSHLPDITVITPVFDSPLTTHHPPLTPTFFTASRAHHAEIGGITPGSMPPFSKNLAEEGILIQNFKLLDAGRSRFDELRQFLTSGHYPSRSPDTNLADITAQVAANHQGAEDLRKMVAQHSLAVVQAYMRHIQAAAERKMRSALAKLPRGKREFTDHLDDGTPIHVAITVGQASNLPYQPEASARDPGANVSLLTTHSQSLNPEPRTLNPHPAATIDFTHTGPISPGNLNANPAIVTAAVMYVLRLLINEDIPLNQGVLAPIELILPECLLNPEPRTLNPASLPAVVGGNVETSQRVVDTLLGAFGLAAASQGTMNNLLFGDDTFGYYETICGGSGATADADGADAVHTHMTNTRLTDPEVLEARYPVRLLEFSIRHNSGGAGLHRGGDGITRRLEFLKPLTLSILSQRRGPYPPYGLHSGHPGALGRNEIRRVGQAVADSAGPPTPLENLVQTTVQPGDILTIQTPGGGGFGLTGGRGSRRAE